MSVSYTHLDVYKRQTIHYCIARAQLDIRFIVTFLTHPLTLLAVQLSPKQTTVTSSRQHFLDLEFTRLILCYTVHYLYGKLFIFILNRKFYSLIKYLFT